MNVMYIEKICWESLGGSPWVLVCEDVKIISRSR